MHYPTMTDHDLRCWLLCVLAGRNALTGGLWTYHHNSGVWYRPVPGDIPIVKLYQPINYTTGRVEPTWAVYVYPHGETARLGQYGNLEEAKRAADEWISREAK